MPSPLKDPSKTDMVIFRENSEDIYAGIEWEAGTDGAKKVVDFLQDEMGVQKIRFPETSSIGIKPVSREGHGAARAQGDRVRDRRTGATRSRSCTRATS